MTRHGTLSIKILGPNYANCQRLETIVRQVAAAGGVTVQIEHVTSASEFMRWPVLATPGLVVNDRLVASGRIPSVAEIAGWLVAGLSAADPTGCDETFCIGTAADEARPSGLGIQQPRA